MSWTTILRQIERASRGRRAPRLPGARRRPGRKSGWSALLVLILGAVWGYSEYSRKPQRPAPTADRPRSAPADVSGVESDDGGIAELFRTRRSDAIVEASGVVLKVLPDDLDTSDGSSRHQRFTVQFAGGRTVLVAHNIDVAERVPLKAGDRVRFRGEYEWSDRGGTVHWTHHDPRGRHADGWIEHAGQTYR